jgi:hypothetical protein
MNVIYLSNIISTKSGLKCPFELLYDERPMLYNNLKIFGKVGIVTTKWRIKAKLSNQGTTSMFVGYTEHQSNYVRIFNFTINSMINSCNIICLNKTYKEWNNAKITISAVEEETIKLPTGIDEIKLTTNATKYTEDESINSDKKVFREMKKLESCFKQQATRAVEDYNCGREITLDQVNLALFSADFV